MKDHNKKALAEAIGMKVLALRLDAELSQESFAAKVGMSKTGVSILECGRSNPSAYTLWRMSKAFDVPLEYWFLP